jgi:AraC-like DNA-binding protein
MLDPRPTLVRTPIQDASKALGVSETHLLRLFRRDVGMSYGKYLRELKMKMAAELLINSAMPIKAVAESCGYTDLSHFYRDFKQTYRLTPRRLRLDSLNSPGEVSAIQMPLVFHSMLTLAKKKPL